MARKALADLEERGQIKKVVGHHNLNIYSMSSCDGVFFEEMILITDLARAVAAE